MPLPNIPVLGLRFDIDKLQHHSSGNYAETAWTIIWRALDPAIVGDSTLWHGDTDATVHRRENVFCIAIQNADAGCLKRAQAILAASSDLNNVASSPLFIEGSNVAGEPLPGDGHLDRNGLIIGQSFHARPALLRERPPSPVEELPPAATALPGEQPAAAVTSVPDVTPALPPPELTYGKLLFAFDGRIGNAAYLAGLLLPIVALLAGGLTAVFVATMFQTIFGPVARGSGLETFFNAAGIILLVIVVILWLWTHVAVAAKRCHDMDVTAAILLIGLIPYVGILVALCLLFIPGTEGANRWGYTMRMR